MKSFHLPSRPGTSITQLPPRTWHLLRCLLVTVFMFTVFSATASARAPESCTIPDCPVSCGGPCRDGFSGSVGSMLSPSRSTIPPSLRGRSLTLAGDFNGMSNQPRRAAAGSPLLCGVNAMCASFSEEQEDVIAWMGFPHTTDDDSDFFIATYGQEAYHLGGGQYATPIWDKRHFWIQVADTAVPLAIQPRYVGTDDSGNDFYSVDFIGYRQPGVDYTPYYFDFSVSALIAEVDSDGYLVDLFIELYDENDKYVGDVDFEIGADFGSFFFGFEDEEPDTIYLFSVEDLIEIEEEPSFFFEEWYPGITFPCTSCGDLDLSSVPLSYMFEAFDAGRATYTDPLPIIAGSTSVVAVPTLPAPAKGLLIALLATGAILFMRIRA